MNNARRKAIKEVQTRLCELEQLMEGICEDIDIIREEEQEAYDNLPEQFQEGERGEAMQEAIEALEDAYSNADDALELIKDLYEQLEG